jgi:hypothetical protein
VRRWLRLGGNHTNSHLRKRPRLLEAAAKCFASALTVAVIDHREKGVLVTGELRAPTKKANLPLFEIALVLVRLDHIAGPHRKRESRHHVNGP